MHLQLSDIFHQMSSVDLKNSNLEAENAEFSSSNLWREPVWSSHFPPNVALVSICKKNKILLF